MKRTIFAVLIAAVVLVAGCSKKKSSSMKLKSDTDSVAYIIGMNVGMNLLQMDSTLNINALLEGVRDAYNQVAKFERADAESYYLRYLNFALPEKARALEEQFLADIVSSNRSYARTTSGVTYTVESVGNQEELPSSDRDSVAVRWIIRTADGHDLYSSYERKDTVRMALGDLLPGVRESVKLIGKGGKITSWVPSSQAYGTEGDATLGVAANTTLCYEIELVEVDKYANRTQRANFRR